MYYVFEADPAKSRPVDKSIGAARSHSKLVSSSAPSPSPCAQCRESVRAEARGDPPGGLNRRVQARWSDRRPCRCANVSVPARAARPPPTGESERARGDSTPTALLHRLLGQGSSSSSARSRTNSSDFSQVCAQWVRRCIQRNSVLPDYLLLYLKTVMAVSDGDGEDAVTVTGWSRFLRTSRGCSQGHGHGEANNANAMPMAGPGGYINYSVAE